MNLNTTRSAILVAVVAGLFGMAGCDKGADSTAPETPAATSEAPATSAPAAEPAAPAESSTAPADADAAPGAESSSTSGEAPAPAADASASADSSLPQTCQDYFKKAEDLVVKAGGSAEQMKQMLDEQRSQMAAIDDQAQLESSCKQALDMLDQQQQQMPQ
ncbi:MAG: DUF5339 family protein [Advenella sp.]|uniref:DUF5339 family protein n=1 Tax=Advenella sp. TaxID=1872388 RepID=UPI0026967332